MIASSILDGLSSCQIWRGNHKLGLTSEATVLAIADTHWATRQAVKPLHGVASLGAAHMGLLTRGYLNGDAYQSTKHCLNGSKTGRSPFHSQYDPEARPQTLHSKGHPGPMPLLSTFP
eukprot:scaffold249597_cov22-Tisochrysis_lutea.AAC.1